MAYSTVRSFSTAVVTAALALLLAITLVPGAVSAQEVQRQQHPETEDGDHKGDARHWDWNLQAEYSDSFGVQEVGHFETPMGFNGDVVAHGRYAYLASWGNQAGNFDQQGDPTGEAPFCPSQGVRVFDLVDPRNPRHVATFADASEPGGVDGSWTEKVIVADVDTEDFTGTLAAVSIQVCDLQPDREEPGFRGFGLYDVTDPTDPQRLALVESIAGNGSHEIFLEARDGEAYVYTAEINQELLSGDVEQDDPGTPDMRIFDVSDPTDPDWIGDWGVWSDEGIVPNEPDEDGIPRARFVHSVIVSDEVAYVSYWSRGTILLDVADPSDPTFISSIDVPTEGQWSRGSFHSTWLADGGDLLIEAPEVFNPVPAEGSDQEHAFGYPRFTDISDPVNPEVVGSFELDSTRAQVAELPPGFWTVHDPKVRPGLPGDDTLAYFSWYAEGVVVTDITDPTDVDQTAQFVPEPHADPFGFFQPEGVEFPHVWGVYLHEDFAGRGQYALASDINSGLWVFRLDEEVPDGLCDDLPPAEFDDVTEENAHFVGISCVVAAEIALGTSVDPPLFSPLRSVTRAQMATFVAQTLDAAGWELPDAGEQIFDDVPETHVHYENINRLARAGIVLGQTETIFNPSGSVLRGQTATFLVQALEWALDDDIDPAGDTPFADAVGTTHEANITAAAELGLVLGRADGTYGPSADTRRDQMATVVTRLLNSLELSHFPVPPHEPDNDTGPPVDDPDNGNDNDTEPPGNDTPPPNGGHDH